jgi:hypothetical protein
MFVRPELAQDPTISLAVPITWAMLSFLALIAMLECWDGNFAVAA